MNARIARTGRAGAPAQVEQIERGEIHGVQNAELESKSRLLLSPAEAALSLPPSTELPNAVAPLTEILGARLTVDNPAWSGDPVPGMRMLQKTLVEASLRMSEEVRPDLLNAISLVEKAVQMRLRWQQMRRSEAEAEAGLVADDEERACEPG